MSEVSKRKNELRAEYNALKDGAQRITENYTNSVLEQSALHNDKMDRLNSRVDLLVEEYKILNLVQFCQTGKYPVE